LIKQSLLRGRLSSRNSVWIRAYEQHGRRSFWHAQRAVNDSARRVVENSEHLSVPTAPFATILTSVPKTALEGKPAGGGME